MLRRTEFLITEIRNSTDNVESNGVKDAEIIGYLNYGQKLIQNIVFKQNVKADLFRAEVEYAPTQDGIYTLPDDIFAVNAIALVEGRFGADQINGGYRQIKRIDKSEASNFFGYYTENNVLRISGLEQNFYMERLRVTYFRVLPRIDKRWGAVQTVNPNTSLVLAAGYDVNAETVDDVITVVNRAGSQIRNNIAISSFSGATWNTSDALTGVTNQHFVCMGKNSVNASELPEACEPYLLDYVRQRVYTRNNYEDAGKQLYFTDKQQADIASLFANNQKDVLVPPVTDTDYLEF
jgi:hypothetical protein